MKLHLLLALALSAVFVGCNSATPPGPRPFIGILNAKKIGTGPKETSRYDVLVHYENVVPDKFEAKVGFGYIPSDKNLKSVAASATGIYAIAHNEILHQSSGDLHLTIEPTAVRDLNGTLDGKIHAVLAPYPHGTEWRVAGHDVFPLAPE